MPDSAYHNAVRKREVLAAEIERIQAELVKIEHWLGMWRELSSAEDTTQTPTPTQPLPPPERPEETQIGGRKVKPRRKSKPRTGPAREEIAPVAREIILSKGHPMPRSALLDALDGRGLHVGGADRAGRIRNVGTVMWRLRDRFRNIEGRGYWPVDVPFENRISKIAAPANVAQFKANAQGRTDSDSAAGPDESVSEGFEGSASNGRC